ncbi:hypothetical protein GV67_20880 [Pseudorhizobium pelagicum]|uniref:Uncharacterized protein n=1 Tax=Pseudorhizobium pelagicum TaxID=1509405 RepID=A0A922T8W4_9HYPH|nr:hypothetical protein GV67_20880 [Pseudorhizobium pelagicum]KEQ05824.1 hypothetical protein GV68_07930 [Pseudorhizobium pelagicum]
MTSAGQKLQRAARPAKIGQGRAIVGGQQDGEARPRGSLHGEGDGRVSPSPARLSGRRPTSNQPPGPRQLLLEAGL